VALTQVAMNFGEGLFPTDTGLGDCISFAQAVIDDDPEFLGPEFTVAFRARLTDDGLDGTPVAVQIDSASLNFRRWSLSVEPLIGSMMTIRGQVFTTACGLITVFEVDVTKDELEHSYAWSYDGNGVWAVYFDGGEVDSGSSPCSDLSAPASAGDLFTIWGSTVSGVPAYEVDEVRFASAALDAAAITAWHSNPAAN
jgi:hypothetical protein